MRNKSLFKLHKSFDLSLHDEKVLSLLYQPLLGGMSYSLYLTLYHLVESNFDIQLSHQQLFDLLDLKQIEFLKSRNKLEALNLLMVYYHKEKDMFTYVLKMPLSAKQFLLDTVFGSYLQSEIGEQNVSLLASLFRIKDLDLEGYQNISKTFDQMYEFKSLNLLKLDGTYQGRVQNGGSHIGYQFDYDKFVENLPERLKNSTLLNQKLQKQIAKIAFVYQYTVEDMIQIYTEANKARQVINFHNLNHKAKLYYEKKNQKLTIKPKDISKSDIIKSAAPQAIIQKYCKTDQQGLALQTATSLIDRNHVDVGIINVILMFILKHKDGILPNLKYMEIVLNDWLNKGIQTAEDALKYSTLLESSWEKKKTSKKSIEPDWMDDYVKELKEMEENA